MVCYSCQDKYNEEACSIDMVVVVHARRFETVRAQIQLFPKILTTWIFALASQPSEADQSVLDTILFRKFTSSEVDYRGASCNVWRSHVCYFVL
mmetsp:Transcript_28677/g.68386  ORF Transcript_28677/g.68386 Transcript_28677/m.68386 type:complete len:94 (+) Transcript_28677:817-1098(+)